MTAQLLEYSREKVYNQYTLTGHPYSHDEYFDAFLLFPVILLLNVDELMEPKPAITN